MRLSFQRLLAPIFFLLLVLPVALAAEEAYEEDDIGFDDVIAVIEDHRPSLADLIENLPEELFEDEEAVEEMVIEHLGWVVEVSQEDEEFSEAYIDAGLVISEAELELMLYLYEQEQNGDEPDVEKVTELVTAVFAAKIVLYELELADLQRELAEQQQRLADVQANREKIISRRVDDLLGDNDDDLFNW